MLKKTAYQRKSTNRDHLIRPCCIVLVLWLIKFMSAPVLFADNGTYPSYLTREEQTWLDQHASNLKLYFNTDFPPIEFASPDNTFVGMGADIIYMVEAQLGVTFPKVPSKDWVKHLAALESGACAIAPTIVQNADRERYAFFTTPYAVAPVVIITTKSFQQHTSLDDLAGRRVAVVAGFATETYVREQYGDRLNLVTVNNVGEGLRSVSFGQTDAFVENLAVAAYHIEKEGVPNLKVAGSTDYQFAWSIGVSRKYPLLYSAIQKALASIPKKDLATVRKRWISLETENRLSPETIRRLQFAALFTALLIAGLSIISFFLKRQLNEKVRHLRLAQEKLASSERWFRAIFDHAPYAIAINDLETGKFLDANKAYVKRSGILKEDLLHLRPEDISPVSEDEKKKVLDALKRTGAVKNVETAIDRQDGTRLHLIYSSVLMELQGHRQILSMTVDVTDWKRAEQTLRESEFRFRTFFNSNPEGVLLIDFDGIILDANKALVDISGYRLSDLVNRHFKTFIPEKYHHETHKALLAIEAGVSQKMPHEIEYIGKNGSALPISIKGFRITDESSNPVSLGIFVHDLTKERRLTEEKQALTQQLQQTQKMEAIGTLAGGIAHDFNNILVGIMGYAELALMAPAHGEASKGKGYINQILEAANRAKELVQQILKFSRREEAIMEKVAITPIVKESIKLLRSALPKTITIEQHIDLETDAIKGDPTQLHQVIMNLCTNAYHAMRDTGGVLTLSLKHEHLLAPKAFMSLTVPPGEYLKLSISDTGCGIDPSTLERIFDPYFTTKKVNEGTGLGLSVSLGIIRGHGGLIELESEVGKGTRFDIYLPAAKPSVSREQKQQIGLPKGNHERVLVVDDERFFLDVVKGILEYLDYEIVSCQSSLKALEIFKRDPKKFDLLITDLTMPEMTGVQLIQEIKKYHPDLPVILCTGYSDTITEQSAAHQGITKFLMKPVNTHDLAMAAHEALTHKA